jgi:PAS domain S-box-containing protein
LPWGTDLCQFYQTQKDLLEILVPYFKAGLKNNELCVWVTSKPLSVENAKKALEAAVHNFHKYILKGQVEIIPYSRWRVGGGKNERSLVSKLDKAILSGFDGLRFACNASNEQKNGKNFVFDGADVISSYNVIAIFTYPRDKFDAAGLMEVVKNHRYALVRNAGRWEVIESSEARIVKNALKRSEEKLHSLFSNMSEGFAYHRIVLDAEGRPCDYIFLEINEAFERLTGLKSRNIIGKRVTEILPGIDKESTDWIGKYGKVAMTGESVHFESHSEQLERWYSISAFSPHKGYFAVTFSDITERKRMEQALYKAHNELEMRVRERTAELERANQELQDFAFIASHDLQEPLRKIQVFSDKLKTRHGTFLDDEGRDNLERIKRAAEQSQKSTRALYSHCLVTNKPEDFTRIYLKSMIEEIAANLEPEIIEAGACLEIGEMGMVEAEPTQMRQLFRHLIENAIKFRGKDTPVIRVYGKFAECLPNGEDVPAGNWYQVFVEDNGIGFDEKYRDIIFTPFQQLHKRGKYEGVGMGLATCRKIVEHHKGFISVSAKTGQGAVFIVFLPARQERRSSIEES